MEARRKPLSCAALGWLVVLNPAGIEAHPFYFGLRVATVLDSESALIDSAAAELEQAAR